MIEMPFPYLIQQNRNYFYLLTLIQWHPQNWVLDSLVITFEFVGYLRPDGDNQVVSWASGYGLCLEQNHGPCIGFRPQSPWFPRKAHSPLSLAVILAGLSKKPFGSASAN